MSRNAASLVLGVDGGGTSTVAWLADAASGAVLGTGRAGPSNAKTAGMDAARAALEAARAAAYSDAGLGPPFPVAAVCVGLAGCDRPEDRARFSPWFADWAGPVLLVNDAEPVVAAGNPDGWGIAVIAGTGSICFGRAPDGTTARAGGWGPLVGDEGSAYAVAVAAIRHVLSEYDGRTDLPPDAGLRDALGRALGEPDPGRWALILYAPDFDRARVAALAAAVIVAADEGSRLARMHLIHAGQQLARAVRAVHRRLAWPEGADRGFPLALAGGFLLRAAVVRDELVRVLPVLEGLDAAPRLVPDPAAGAVALARRLLPDPDQPRTIDP